MASVAHKIFEFEGFSLDLKRGCLRAADGEVALRPRASKSSATLSRMPAASCLSTNCSPPSGRTSL
jgi:hypothetical protein